MNPISDTSSHKFLGTDTEAGAGIYFPWVLNFVYDHLVLGFYNTFVWCCPTNSVLLPLWSKHTSRPQCKVLDIGVGTGYYPSHASLQPDARLLLVDLNPNALAMSHSRVRKSHPDVKCKTLQEDILCPGAVRGLGMVRDEGLFDAVSVMFLFHCLPGPPARKASLLAELRDAVEPEKGVLFGSTILGKGVDHNFLGRLVMKWHNSWGIFGNRDDDAEVFVTALREVFEVVEWRVVGAVLLFEASRPRQS